MPIALQIKNLGSRGTHNVFDPRAAKLVAEFIQTGANKEHEKAKSVAMEPCQEKHFGSMDLQQTQYESYSDYICVD